LPKPTIVREPVSVRGSWSVLCCAVIVAVGVWAWMAESPQAAKSEPRQFSATRAISTLAMLLRENAPHPMGSARNAEVRRRIEADLQAMGYVPEEEAAYVCSSSGNCGTADNVVVQIPGEIPSPAVLMDAHYDSVGAGAGAADDGSGVAILLEIARLLKTRPMPRHRILLLFDDGEEQSMLGATAFIEHSRFAKDVHWVVNLEARGVRGPSMMFETSAHNAGLIQLYAATAPHPVSNSLMYSLYKMLPSDTNFTIYREHGKQGYNLAFVGGTPFYHRTGDVVAHTSSASVQQQGEVALGLVEALANHPPQQNSRGDAVFFDVLGRMVWWPQGVTLFFVLALVVLQGMAIERARRIQNVTRSIAWGMLAVVGAMAAAGLWGFGLLQILLPGALSPPDFPAHLAALLIAFASSVGAICAFLIAWISGRSGFWGFLLGEWLVWTTLAIAFFFVLPGGSYLFLLPVLAGTACFVLISWFAAWHAAEIALTVGAAVAAALWLPLLRLIYQGLGKVGLPICAVVLAALLMLVLPLLWERKRILLRASVLAGITALVFAIVAFFTPRYSEGSPFPLNLMLVQDSTAGSSHWLFAISARNRARAQPLFAVAAFQKVKKPAQLLPWLPAGYPLYAASAPNLALPLPEMQVIRADGKSGVLSVHARLRSPRNADLISLYFPPATKIKFIRFEGITVPTVDADVVAAMSGWQRYTSTTSREGIDVAFELAGGDTSAVYVVDESYGLPSQGELLLLARPRDASASQDGDLTVLFQKIDLAPLLVH
jgi:hypothetical protein